MKPAPRLFGTSGNAQKRELFPENRERTSGNIFKIRYNGLFQMAPWIEILGQSCGVAAFGKHFAKRFESCKNDLYGFESWEVPSIRESTDIPY